MWRKDCFGNPKDRMAMNTLNVKISSAIGVFNMLGLSGKVNLKRLGF